MSSDVELTPAIVVDSVSKRFRLPHERTHTLKERALHPFRRTRYGDLEGLQDISFTVQPGEFFGIVGRNGSGKSTLLKCLAGIYGVDQGSIYVNGRLSTFIELGVGFNPDLAARDNVILNAIMLGLTPAEARERVDRVIEFAELEDFADLKLKNYSSGMHVRLAFAVMIQVDADILLIDEVLAVGDAAFQHKCYVEFERMRTEGRTILFVTHDMDAVARFCHRAALLERGEMVALGEPAEIAGEYLALNLKTERAADPLPVLRDRAAFVADAWFEDENGERRNHVPPGGRCVCRTRVEFNERLLNPTFGLAIESGEGTRVFAATSDWSHEKTGEFLAGEEVVFSVAFDNVFVPGTYYATPHISLREGGGAGIVDRRDRAAVLVVTGAEEDAGLVEIPHEVTIERMGAAEAKA